MQSTKLVFLISLVGYVINFRLAYTFTCLRSEDTFQENDFGKLIPTVFKAYDEDPGPWTSYNNTRYI